MRHVSFTLSIYPEQVYCTETRPYNQGARLTAYELVHDNIPATLIVDSMVAALMKLRNISAVVVGADRVCEIEQETCFFIRNIVGGCEWRYSK